MREGGGIYTMFFKLENYFFFQNFSTTEKEGWGSCFNFENIIFLLKILMQIFWSKHLYLKKKKFTKGSLAHFLINKFNS